MTAIIGVLNKSSIAIAADSAVTVSDGSGRKIYQNANKIFTLSKYHPVGISIYNSASFLGTPWETIIKMYRKSLGDRLFDTLEEYQEDFIQYIHDQDFFSSQKNADNYSMRLIERIIVDILNQVVVPFRVTSIKDINEDEFKKKLDSTIKTTLARIKTFNKVRDLEDYSLEDFQEFTKGACGKIFKSHTGFSINEELLLKLEEFTLEAVKIVFDANEFSGLVFFGFGDKEIFPKCISIKVAESFDGYLRMDDTEPIMVVDHEHGATIAPFAQRDVIDTILTGISDDIEESMMRTFEKVLRGYEAQIAKHAAIEKIDVSKVLNKIDTKAIVESISGHLNKVKGDKHVNPTIRAVALLSKEDLAEMAESLIYITYLKRRFSMSEESVSGAVDVAVVSKGDGFIWIKRKHYFKPELNKFFFENYFT